MLEIYHSLDFRVFQRLNRIKNRCSVDILINPTIQKESRSKQQLINSKKCNVWRNSAVMHWSIDLNYKKLLIKKDGEKGTDNQGKQIKLKQEIATRIRFGIYLFI